MAVDLICPDCGGVIGGTPGEGQKPCICFKDAGSAEKSDNSDTVSLPAQQPEPAERSGEKLCIRCGKNVSGHRRVKDSRGYLCLACAKEEMREERAGTVPCAECGRRIKPAGLIAYAGIRICRSCYEHHKERKRFVRKVPSKHFEAHERQRLLLLLGVFILLGLIVVWRTFFYH